MELFQKINHNFPQFQLIKLQLLEDICERVCAVVLLEKQMLYRLKEKNTKGVWCMYTTVYPPMQPCS